MGKGNLSRVQAILPCLLIVGACTAGTSKPPEDDGTVPAFAPEYRIGIGDSLQIDVYKNPDVSAAVTVRPDGKITVPVAGDVAVGGKTPVEVSAVVAKALSEYIRDPIVTTTVAGMGSAEYLTRVRVTGAVTSPQSIPFRNGMTVLDVVLEAGGPNDYANTSKVKLYRANGETLTVNLERIMKRGDMRTNYPLRPGDVITVPQSLF